MTDITPETNGPTDFIAGESDPYDFTVDQVAAFLGTASPQEFDRVLDLEDQGKARKGILDLTREEAQEDALEAANPPDPEAPQVGDTETSEDGYTRVVVSVD